MMNIIINDYAHLMVVELPPLSIVVADPSVDILDLSIKEKDLVNKWEYTQN